MAFQLCWVFDSGAEAVIEGQRFRCGGEDVAKERQRILSIQVGRLRQGHQDIVVEGPGL